MPQACPLSLRSGRGQAPRFTDEADEDQTADPSLRCLAWGEISVNIKADPATRWPGAGMAVDRGFSTKGRPCAMCGASFETTPTRRLLCARCYRDG